ncbi:uncharacterized protein TNIN_109231 [Trichonephila inaurata madagascariensis]|uniref:T20D4.11-like domain-containing protein n=1 Tax=Trichonephila inaurata madagascariensis TaxID=2747483 RepID=A0A8X6YFQ8_9ARAC|nr:uncharacterized protein TNIN_109231 [Trichonephila inaurata madagascariensis]
MKLLLLLSIGALFGYVACDAECYQKESKECIRNLDIDLSFCNYRPKMLPCLMDAVKKCEMSFLPELQEVQSITEEMCATGTVMNKDYMRLQECLKIVDKDSKCSDILSNIFDDKRTEREKNIAQREACKLYNKVSDCFVESVKKSCGDKNAAFYRWVIEKFNKVQDKICDEVIIPLSKKEERSVNMDVQNVFRSLGLF